jgi:hypothetical protein
MNKKALFNLTANEVAYVILLALAVVLTFMVIWKYTGNAGTWQEYYAKEIVRVIDASKPGDNIGLDVQKGTEVAKRNGVDLLKGNMFNFDSKNQEVCVLLSKGSATCYSYFNYVTIVSDSQPIEFGVPNNVLHFNVVAPSAEHGATT